MTAMEFKVVHFDDGRTWILPAYAVEYAASPAACKSCHAPILWVQTTKGRRAPIDPDGVNHFATCPQAPKWRQTAPKPEENRV